MAAGRGMQKSLKALILKVRFVSVYAVLRDYNVNLVVPEIALIAIQSLEFAAFALAILGTFLIVYYALLCCDGTEDSEPSPKEQPSSPESEAALSSDDNISDIALNATAAGTPSSDSQPRRRQLIIFTVLTTVLFLVALGSLIIKSLFLFTISNMPGISLETSDAAPFIAAANATRPSSFAFMYIISGRNVGPSFILSIMSCILLFSMIHVQILGVLPEADDEKEKKSNSTGATVASAVSRTKPDQTKDGLRSAMRRSQCSPLQSISARSSFSFSSRTLNRSGDVSPAFPLNQDIPASAHFHTISMEDGWFGGGNSSVFSWWVGMKLSMVRLMRRLAGQQPSARTDRMFVGGGKKKVRIVEPFDQV